MLYFAFVLAVVLLGVVVTASGFRAESWVRVMIGLFIWWIGTILTCLGLAISLDMILFDYVNHVLEPMPPVFRFEIPESGPPVTMPPKDRDA